MIGQKVLLDRIKGQVERGKFPRFSIFIGESGSGKRTLAKEVASLMQASCSMVPDVKVDTIREVIEAAYKIDLPIIYVLADCDNLSTNAANALLKVVEEPPKNAYFILTCENLENLLPTIKSRGVTYMLEPYTYEDKLDFLAWEKQLDEEDEAFILEVAANLGDLQKFLAINIKEFRDYVNLVIDNIAVVQGSNAFKIGDKISLKDDDKYNLKLFWRAFSCICVDRMTGEDALKYAVAVALTGDAIQQLSIKGINKDMLFSSWVLDIRSEWL